MRIRIEESAEMPGKLQSTKNLRELMLSGLAQKMDLVVFFKKITNRVLTEKSKRFSVSYILSDGKFGCYYLDNYYFSCCTTWENSEPSPNRPLDRKILLWIQQQCNFLGISTGSKEFGSQAFQRSVNRFINLKEY